MGLSHSVTRLGNFESSWWQIFLQKWPKYLKTFWAFSKDITFKQKMQWLLLDNFWMNLEYFYLNIWSHCSVSIPDVSNTRGPGFDSSHQQDLTMTIFTGNCWKDAKKKKRAVQWLIFKTIKIVGRKVGFHIRWSVFKNVIYL